MGTDARGGEVACFLQLVPHSVSVRPAGDSLSVPFVVPAGVTDETRQIGCGRVAHGDTRIPCGPETNGKSDEKSNINGRQQVRRHSRLQQQQPTAMPTASGKLDTNSWQRLLTPTAGGRSGSNTALTNEGDTDIKCDINSRYQ
eukprot:gene17642-biopygen8089